MGETPAPARHALVLEYASEKDFRDTPVEVVVELALSAAGRLEDVIEAGRARPVQAHEVGGVSMIAARVSLPRAVFG